MWLSKQYIDGIEWVEKEVESRLWRVRFINKRNHLHVMNCFSTSELINDIFKSERAMKILIMVPQKTNVSCFHWGNILKKYTFPRSLVLTIYNTASMDKLVSSVWTRIEMHNNDQVINDCCQCITFGYMSFSFSALVLQMPMGITKKGGVGTQSNAAIGRCKDWPQ